MKQLKSKRQEKLTKQAPSRQLIFSFSLEHLTENANYNFRYFKRDRLRDELNARQGLDKLLTFLSRSTWKAIWQKRRDEFGGTEGIKACFMQFRPSNYDITDDEKILSFRFGDKMEYRLLGLLKPTEATFYIIGLDFDYSAYNHGR